MNRKTIFTGAIIVAVLAAAAAIYYIIPGYTHVLSTNHPMQTQVKHAVGLILIAVVAVVAALANRPKKAE